ncbi:DNA cytosine methyltransferase [Aquimarina spongiae]|uniref:DNA (cytosine-5-)-methyltransferase n=1 Tax=Aquimarina spongiae TaxID=570521 RepID=A0A1M6JEI0_9FLAO|nr:DNA cytosine methyltransferase [Aquimarina spongiae]SHJ45133.1 DNA (cytosine-5)-methyltransferase 1 [Aquimarina spongiae]
MDSTKQLIEEQRVLSFCYGYGGLERGVQQVIPIQPVAYLEIESFQDFNLVAAMEKGVVDSAPIWTDIKTFDPEPFRNRIHGFIGGYPCQGESHAGKRQLWNDPRFLWPHIEKCISSIRPVWCFFENVSGHLSGSFPYVLSSLRDLGYIVEPGLFTASEVGAPHERKRLFILALENTEFAFRWATAQLPDSTKRTQSANMSCHASRKQLVNTQSNGNRGGSCEVSRANEEIQQQYENTKSFKSGKELANTNGKGRKRNGQPSRSKKEITRPTKSGKKFSYTSNSGNGESCKEYQTGKFITNGNKWPARQGKQQHEWEEPRTIKPGMGCTINGYNFRTELLRQYGNGVVSQQAAYAFDNLLVKMIS